jgi:hypothetical protein
MSTSSTVGSVAEIGPRRAAPSRTASMDGSGSSPAATRSGARRIKLSVSAITLIAPIPAAPRRMTGIGRFGSTRVKPGLS